MLATATWTSHLQLFSIQPEPLHEALSDRASLRLLHGVRCEAGSRSACSSPFIQNYRKFSQRFPTVNFGFLAMVGPPA